MDRRRFLEALAAISVFRPELKCWHTSPVSEKVVFDGGGQRQDADDHERTAFMLTDLLASDSTLLGTFRSNTFHVSLNDIENQDYLQFIGDERNALVISAYVSEDSSDGALLRAVTEKLKPISPPTYMSLAERLDGKSLPPTGVVLPFEVKISEEQRHVFPIDSLFVTTFERRASRNDDQTWVPDVFAAAAKQKVQNLILPCLGRNWADKLTIDFEDFFGGVLRNVPAHSSPLNLYFSLYTQWPSFEVIDAVVSLNAAWAKVVSTAKG